MLLINFGFSPKKRSSEKAEKLFDEGDIAGALQILTESESIFANADPKIKPRYEFLKGKIAQNNKEFEAALALYNGLNEVADIQADIKQQLTLLSADIVNSAIDDNNNGDFKIFNHKLYLAYTIDPEVNKDYLYYAASSAVNAEIFEVALDYYNQLKDMNYTGIEKNSL